MKARGNRPSGRATSEDGTRPESRMFSRDSILGGGSPSLMLRPVAHIVRHPASTFLARRTEVSCFRQVGELPSTSSSCRAPGQVRWWKPAKNGFWNGQIGGGSRAAVNVQRPDQCPFGQNGGPQARKLL